MKRATASSTIGPFASRGCGAARFTEALNDRAEPVNGGGAPIEQTAHESLATLADVWAIRFPIRALQRPKSPPNSYLPGAEDPLDPNGKTRDLDGPFVSDPSHGLTSGIILAGTFPWANSAFDRLSPRPLVPVAHRPLISFGLSWLEGAGIRSIAVCGNRNSRGLEAQLRRQCSADVELSYLEDAMPRGAGGCVRDAALMSDSRTFVVTDGAAIPNVDLDDLLRALDAVEKLSFQLYENEVA